MYLSVCPDAPGLTQPFWRWRNFCGLTMAIANPASVELMNVKKAGDVLLAKDKDALRFIEHFSAQANVNSGATATKKLLRHRKKSSARSWRVTGKILYL